jgi:hypothetical protein
MRNDGSIIPGQELGGVAVGTPFVRLANTLTEARVKNSVEYSMSTLFEASYYMRDFNVEIVVDVRNGKISRLTAREGYVGTLSNGVGVGTQVREAIRMEPRFYYDEAEELILCRGVPGIALELAAIDPYPDAVLEMPVHAISVYAAEIETVAGQQGMW